MRRRKPILALLLAVGIACGVANGQAGVPRLISKQQLQVYVDRYLTLSEEQRKYVEQQHEQYLNDWQATFDSEIDRANSLWGAAYKSLDKFEGESMAKAYAEAAAAMDALRSRLKTANDQFFDIIEAGLADEQLPGMHRLRYAHDRYSNKRSGQNALRERNVDVVALLDGMDLSPADASAAGIVLLDFEPTYVALLNEVVNADLKHDLLMFQVYEIARQMRLQGQNEALSAQAEVIEAKALQVVHAPSRRLVECNRNGLKNLCAVLGENAAAQLMDLYYRQAYPEVFPDPVKTLGVIDALVEQVPSLDEARRAAIFSLRTDYQSRHQRLSHEIAQTVFELSSLPFKYAKAFDRERFLEERDAMLDKCRQLCLERESLDLDLPPKTRSLLTPEEVSRLSRSAIDMPKPARPWGVLVGGVDMTATHEADAQAFRAAASQAATRPNSR